jgi:hypothetical protein
MPSSNLPCVGCTCWSQLSLPCCCPPDCRNLSPTSHLQPLALVSDAGVPAISDPGAVLVAAAAAAGHRVIPIPGACAAVAALCASGLPTQGFQFGGFLPDKRAARKAAIARVSAMWDRRGLCQDGVWIRKAFKGVEYMVCHLEVSAQLEVHVERVQAVPSVQMLD